jgi:hypothetical protein
VTFLCFLSAWGENKRVVVKKFVCCVRDSTRALPLMSLPRGQLLCFLIVERASHGFFTGMQPCRGFGLSEQFESHSLMGVETLCIEIRCLRASFSGK